MLKISYANNMLLSNPWFHRFIRAIQLQLFISLISLPFLIAWGLPISILTPISTLIFGPILTIFLLISAFIFFTELLYVPNGILTWSLNQLTNLWLKVLHYEQQSWLIGFAKPAMFWLFSIICCAFFLIHLKKIRNPFIITLLLALLLVCTATILKIRISQTGTLETFPCNNGNVTIITDNNQTMLIDPGFIAARPSATSWLSYTLIPHIIQQTGRLTLDYVVLLQPNKRLFDTFRELITKIKVKKIYLPFWQGLLPKNTWRSFALFKKELEKMKTKLVRINQWSYTIRMSKNTIIHLEPLLNRLRYNTVTYPSVRVTGTIDNEMFTLYAAKHSKNKGKS